MFTFKRKRVKCYGKSFSGILHCFNGKKSVLKNCRMGGGRIDEHIFDSSSKDVPSRRRRNFSFSRSLSSAYIHSFVTRARRSSIGVKACCAFGKRVVVVLVRFRETQILLIRNIRFLRTYRRFRLSRPFPGF